MSKKQQNKENKIDSSGSTVRQTKLIPGLMSCVFIHRTSQTTAEFNWTGQTLNVVWPTVLAFLKWTYDTYRSESQLRLFVNKNTGEWAAWAFPQKAHTGMTAKEITEGEPGYERTKEQRARFPDTEGWYYWGTVHHHCSSSAFQSGTDTANEQDQDGIHITVGHMDKNQYDIHFRIYVSGYKLTSITPLDFWDTGDEMNTVPPKFRALLPTNAEELLARQQMGMPAPQGTEFPQEWRDNIIDVTPKQVPTVYQSGTVIGGASHGGGFGRTYTEKSEPNLDYDLNRAYRKMRDLIRDREKDPGNVINKMSTVIDALDELDKMLHAEVMDIMAICVESDVLPGNLAFFMEKEIAEEELRQQQREQQKENAKMLGEGGHQPPSTVHTAGLNEHGQPNHWYYNE